MEVKQSTTLAVPEIYQKSSSSSSSWRQFWPRRRVRDVREMWQSRFSHLSNPPAVFLRLHRRPLRRSDGNLCPFFVCCLHTLALNIAMNATHGMWAFRRTACPSFACLSRRRWEKLSVNGSNEIGENLVVLSFLLLAVKNGRTHVPFSGARELNGAR